MRRKITVVNVGISDGYRKQWDMKNNEHYRVNRLHMPMEGKVLYSNISGTVLLDDSSIYLLPHGVSQNFSMLPGYVYRHLYIDFKIFPPLASQSVLEIPKAKDHYLYHLLKAVGALVEEVIRTRGHTQLNPRTDHTELEQVNYLLPAMVEHLHIRYQVNGVENDKLEEALNYIDAHYTEPLSVEELAAVLHVDRRYLIRLFNRYLQMPPYQYITQCRIEHSIICLQTGKSVSEAAELCGYQSENAYRAAFKKVMGKPPTALLR